MEVLGASGSVISGELDWPLQGLRHPPEANTSGWYVRTGELLPYADFFQPWHAAHLVERCPQGESLLQMPPGSRFLLAPGYVDVWDDPALLDLSD